MRNVYQAANAVEAHMICDLLRQEGIPAQVFGEHLQGAVGELPAAGLVRVMVVEDDDYDRGRAVIARWEASMPAEAPAATASSGGSRTGRRLWPAFLVGLGLGCAAVAAYHRVPVAADGIDHNRDGILDETWTFATSGRVVRIDTDRNLDGRIDQVSYFDPPGMPTAMESDDDFDGTFESRTQMRNGNPGVTETDTDRDGYPDLRWRFSYGVADTLEYLNPATGLPLRVEHFRLGRLTHAEVDTDRDGVLDQRLKYSGLGEVEASERLAAP